MKLYHTSPAPINCVNGELNFKRIYAPESLGLHAWHKRHIAEDRMKYSENDFLYEFDYPISSIEELKAVEHSDLAIYENEPIPVINEIAVKLQEDTGAGVNQYHAVVIDYSRIKSWRELYANRDSKYLTVGLDRLSQSDELTSKNHIDESEEDSKNKRNLNFIILFSLLLAVIFLE
jgi:hypothetical protein